MISLERYGNERDCELPWLAAQPHLYPLLDVGCHDSIYLNDFLGVVDGIDVRETRNEALRQFYQADIRTWRPPEKYPMVVAISTLEHIGLKFDPYGTEDDDEDGDRHALDNIREHVLAPDGVLLLTVPFGPSEHFGWYRVYDEDDLDMLLASWDWTAEYVENPTWQVGGVALITARLR